MLSGFGFYKTYFPLKLHFTSSYDALKYHNSIRSLDKESFQGRKDSSRFEYWGNKIQSKEEALKYCVLNFSAGNDNWIYDDFDQAKEVYYAKSAYYSSLSRNLKAEYKIITSTMKEKDLEFDQLTKKTPSGSHPPLLQMLLKGYLSKEFICLLGGNFLEKWQEELALDPMINKEIGILTKYKPFAIMFSRGIK